MLSNTIILIFVCALLFVPQTALAIVNVLSTQQKSEGLSGKVNASVAHRSGNTNLVQFSGGVDVAWGRGVHSTTLSARGDYGEKSDEKYLSKVFEHLRYRYGYNDWLTFEALLQHQYDAFKHLKFRGLTGAGMALSWDPLEDLGLTWGLTYLLEYEVEEGDEIELGSFGDYGHRFSTYLQVALALAEAVSLKSTTFFQPLISDASDVRLLSESALNVKATDSFSVKVSYTAAYDSAPFEVGDGESELEKLDTDLKTSLVFTF